MTRWAWLALALIACNGSGKESGTETDTDADTDADTDSDTDTDTDVEAENPEILDADAWCYQHTTGQDRWLWRVEATGDDPQGVATLEPFGHTIDVLEGSTTIVQYIMACELEGQCYAAFDEVDDDILCSEATSYTFRITLVDVDGNWSESMDVTGRQGTSDG